MILGESWKIPRSIPGGTTGGFPGRTPVEFLVQLPAEFLEQLAGKFLKEVRWNSWRNSGKIPGETPDEFWKVHVRKSLWNS